MDKYTYMTEERYEAARAAIIKLTMFYEDKSKSEAAIRDLSIYYKDGSKDNADKIKESFYNCLNGLVEWLYIYATTAESPKARTYAFYKARGIFLEYTDIIEPILTEDEMNEIIRMWILSDSSCAIFKPEDLVMVLNVFNRFTDEDWTFVD